MRPVGTPWWQRKPCFTEHLNRLLAVLGGSSAPCYRLSRMISGISTESWAAADSLPSRGVPTGQRGRYARAMPPLDPLRIREHLHGHLGWLAVLALAHPAILLRNHRRRAHLSVALAVGVSTLAAAVGVSLYGPYRERLRQPIFASARERRIPFRAQGAPCLRRGSPRVGGRGQLLRRYFCGRRRPRPPAKGCALRVRGSDRVCS